MGFMDSNTLLSKILQPAIGKSSWMNLISSTPHFRPRILYSSLTFFLLGLKNAPATFQCLLQTLFKHLGILPYIDDLVIASKTFGDHIQTICNVLWKLRSANLKLNPSKCKFAEFSIVYLGLSVSAGGGIRPNPDKIDKLKQMSVPQSRVAYFLNLFPDLPFM